MHKNNGEINIDKIKKMFPDDKKLHEHLENMQKEFEENQQNTINKYNQEKLLKRAQSKNFQRKPTHNNSIHTNSTLNNNDDFKNKTTKIRPKSSKKINKKNSINNNNNKSNQIKNKNLNSSIQIQEHPPINKNEKLSQDKINFMVNDYTKKLMSDFLKFCEKEKKANKERDKLINEASNEQEKRRLAKILALQRGQSSDKIGEYNKMIDEKIEDYKEKLNNILINQNQ